MRYKITKSFRKLIRGNRKQILFKNKDIFHTVKNSIYSNKTINKNQLENICKVLKIKTPNLKEYKFNQEENFGIYHYTPKVRFKGISKELAEFIGIMLGDGGIYQNQITIVIDSRDSLLKNHIKRLFRNLFKLELHEYKQKNQNALKLYRCNKAIVKILLRYGLKRGNKVKNEIKIPSWIKLDNDYTVKCLRGLILTDGCVYYSKRDRQTYVKFTNNCKNLLEDFQEAANKIGFDFVNANKSNKTLYKKDQVARFINTLSLANLRGISASLESFSR